MGQFDLRIGDHINLHRGKSNTEQTKVKSTHTHTFGEPELALGSWGEAATLQRLERLLATTTLKVSGP